jgi:tetratricopeptide (TPR) repeat protein
MSETLEQLSARARNAAFRRDWNLVVACSRAMLERDDASAEGHFLSGLALKAAGRPDAAIAAFERSLALDAGRHDAAVELAHQLVGRRRHGDAAELVGRYQGQLANSPVYLNMAGSILATLGQPERAWPLFARAVELQPGVDLFAANLAACGVFIGKIDESKALYRRLLERFPAHQRYHYQLARLQKASDGGHVETMQRILAAEGRPPKDNVFMYYAIGKELEDLERWDEAFDYFEKAGNAVAGVADYDVAKDIELIDAIIDSSSAAWLVHGPPPDTGAGRVPVFVVGLPRSGTTLVDRILSSHPDVASVGETQYLPTVVRGVSGIDSDRKMTPAMIRAAAALPIDAIGKPYLQMLSVRLGGERFFVD